MNIPPIASAVFTVLGGLTLFIIGSRLMADGIRQAAGTRRCSGLSRVADRPLAGFLAGLAFGTAAQRGATLIMLTDFCNAGLMSLPAAIPPMLGANVGTSLSMQLISLRPGATCYAMIALGGLLAMAAPAERARQAGRALLGFGLLFLGMMTIGSAVQPHRETLAPWLAAVDGTTAGGWWAILGVSVLLTALWQSSGVTLGMVFPLVAAGVLTRLDQVFPIILGAHIGGAVMTQIIVIGASIEARRTAVAHLLFNLINVALAIVMKPLWLLWIPMTSTDLVRQTANLHTAVMVTAALPLLPLASSCARQVARLVRPRGPMPETSHLDRGLLDEPEQAIRAAIRELRRIARVCDVSLRLLSPILLRSHARRSLRRIKLNEQVIDAVKIEMKDYLTTLTRRPLSRRQAILLQHLDRCVTDIERIGDHIDAMGDISVRRERIREAFEDRAMQERLFLLYRGARVVLRLVIHSLNPENRDFHAVAQSILTARDRYMRLSLKTKGYLFEELNRRQASPVAALFFAEYVSAFDRIVKHARSIALAERHSDFWIQTARLERATALAARQTAPPRSDAETLLERLHMDDA